MEYPALNSHDEASMAIEEFENSLISCFLGTVAFGSILSQLDDDTRIGFKLWRSPLIPIVSIVL